MLVEELTPKPHKLKRESISKGLKPRRGRESEEDRKPAKARHNASTNRVHEHCDHFSWSLFEQFSSKMEADVTKCVANLHGRKQNMCACALPSATRVVCIANKQKLLSKDGTRDTAHMHGDTKQSSDNSLRRMSQTLQTCKHETCLEERNNADGNSAKDAPNALISNLQTTRSQRIVSVNNNNNGKKTNELRWTEQHNECTRSRTSCAFCIGGTSELALVIIPFFCAPR